MNRRLLVTGAGGFVAGSVIRQAGPEWEVHALSRGAAACERDGLHWHSFDLRDVERLRETFRDAQPDAVIHAAAVADIDYCEAHPDEAKQVNAEVTRELARLCGERRSRFVYLSTDTVFDGVKGFYSEKDPPGPLNVYAETKVMGEEAAAGMPEGWAVARTSLVMGFPVLETGNSFLSRMVPKFEAGEQVGVPENEIRSPIDVITLGQALLELAASEWSGFIHLAGNDVLNRYEMVCRIATRLGFSSELVFASDPGAIPGRAPRPRDASLNNALARGLLKTPMLGLAEGLERVIAAREGNQP